MANANPFEHDGQWLKANLHTHTKTSDGEATLEERVRQYRLRDYDVLAITDHNRTNEVERHSTPEFLVLSGMEIHPPCSDHPEPYHLACLNVPIGFDVPERIDVNDGIERVRQAGGEAVLAHPYWSGLTVNQLLPVQGHIAIEVYNATCTKHGKGFSSVQWDELLDAGRLVSAVACDDTHRGRDIFMGWTMVKAQELTPAAVLESLRSGQFYASCGPVIDDFRLQDGQVSLACSPVVDVHFIAQFSYGHSCYAGDGETLTSAEFILREGTRFVRAEVVDGAGHRAWTNPLVP